MGELPAMAKVVVTSFVFWGVLLAAVLTAIATEATDILPENWQRWILAAAGIVTIAVRVLRRVSPVEASQRGILPPKN